MRAGRADAEARAVRAARPRAVILPLVPGRSGAAPGSPPDPGARWLPDTDEVDADGEPGVSVPRWSGARVRHHRVEAPLPVFGACAPALGREREAHPRAVAELGGELSATSRSPPAFRWGSAFSTTGGASAGVTSAMAEEQGHHPDLQLAWGRWGWRSGRTRSRGLPSRRVQCRTISAARGEIRKFARSRCPSSRNSLRSSAGSWL